jgi:hypothetical protein
LAASLELGEDDLRDFLGHRATVWFWTTALLCLKEILSSRPVALFASSEQLAEIGATKLGSFPRVVRRDPLHKALVSVPAPSSAWLQIARAPERADSSPETFLPIARAPGQVVPGLRHFSPFHLPILQPTGICRSAWSFLPSAIMAHARSSSSSISTCRAQCFRQTSTIVRGSARAWLPNRKPLSLVDDWR